MDRSEMVPALAVAGVGALVVGPFLSHAVLRWMGWRVILPVLLGFVPSRDAVRAARMRCRRCETPVPSWGAALPVMPWLAVAGRCRRCRDPLPGWVAAIEVATAATFGLATWRIGLNPALVPVLVLCAGLVAASAVDLACLRIPTRFVWLTAAAATVAIVVAAALDGVPRSALGALVGAGTYFALLAPLHLISPRLLGFGDVRLGVLAGLVVGWLAWTAELPVYGPMSGVLHAVLLSSLLGLVVGLGFLLTQDARRAYPFGPWLSLGAFVVILASG